MAERATALIRPVKVREYDAELHCDTLRVVGYSVHCKCGWPSGTHPTITSARAALANHRAGGHAKPGEWTTAVDSNDLPKPVIHVPIREDSPPRIGTGA